MKLHRGWGLLPMLLLAGCGALQPADPGRATTPVIEEIRDGDAAMALAYYAQLRQLTGQELMREHESARRALAKTRSDANRLRYALLLTLPGVPVGGEPRAQELLEPVMRSNDAALRGLALLVMTSLQVQRRLETHVQGLQQKLDALLALERNMTRDGSGTRKR